MAAPRRAAPFKAPAVYPEEELLILGDLPSHPMRPLGEMTTSFFRRGTQGTVPSDFDLLSSTMRRVGQLEQRVRGQEQEMRHKDEKIVALEEKIKRLQSHRTAESPPAASPPAASQAQALKRCQELQQRLCDMERFLSDYGLVWVGEDDAAAAREQDRDLSSTASFQPDYNLILENLGDLNMLAGEGESRIEYREGGARLRQADPIPLTLYNNGIIMFNGPFRSHQELSTQQLLRDIMDGYFPSELQRRFPDGVIFQVTDRRSVIFRERRPWGEFPGTGQRVGNMEGDGRVQETSEMPGRHLTVDQFLNRLPKSVVQGGQVLDIREPIREALQGSGHKGTQEILIESPNVTTEERSQLDGAISTLRIKSESGDDTYLLRMLSTETVGNLRSYLSQCRAPDLGSYDVLSRFPHRVYDDDTHTLQECGLVPNASLFLRAKRVEGLRQVGTSVE
ncbi:UBX domain-containing protein 11 isoform X3 [Ascaphus truei]|uniref:UBX domain-containing protein 11 isoform X3 n=1 Tax=Ascaphus truei TaxID=8439 RepID=UPI003F5A9BA4